MFLLITFTSFSLLNLL